MRIGKIATPAFGSRGELNWRMEQRAGRRMSSGLGGVEGSLPRLGETLFAGKSTHNIWGAPPGNATKSRLIKVNKAQSRSIKVNQFIN